jgi:hypothetical protein
MINCRSLGIYPRLRPPSPHLLLSLYYLLRSLYHLLPSLYLLVPSLYLRPIRLWLWASRGMCQLVSARLDPQQSVAKVRRRTEAGDAPGWQGATSENTGSFCARRNAARRDAAPAECS